jgi:dihydroflavonol-4-reductase
MNTLVTGGTGFIGANLVAALVARGDHVRVLRRDGSSLAALEGLDVECVTGDVLDQASVERAVTGCDQVFHVAAVASYWRTPRERIYEVNVEGTRIVMEACLRAGVHRVVHTSSVSAIGIPARGSVGTEETLFDPVSAAFPYADSKRLAEEVVRNAVAQGLSAVIVNPATVFGPRDHYFNAGAAIIHSVRGRTQIAPPGGMCVADVDAIVQGHLAAAERGRIGERYILGGENLSYLAIAQIIADVCGSAAPRFVAPAWILPPVAVAVDLFNRLNLRPPIVSGEQIRMAAIQFFFDSQKAVRELDYPLLPFRDAVAQAYAWYKARGYIKPRTKN